MVEVWPNSSADEERAADPSTGYLYYRFEVEFSPIFGPATESRQIELARRLIARARARGWPCVACANFEDKI